MSRHRIVRNDVKYAVHEQGQGDYGTYPKSNGFAQNTPPAAKSIFALFLYYLTISPSLPGCPRPMLTMIMTMSTTFTIDEYHEDEGDDDPEMGA